MYAQKKVGPVGGVRLEGKQIGHVQSFWGIWVRVERVQPTAMMKERKQRIRLWTAVMRRSVVGRRDGRIGKLWKVKVRVR